MKACDGTNGTNGTGPCDCYSFEIGRRIKPQPKPDCGALEIAVVLLISLLLTVCIA